MFDAHGASVPRWRDFQLLPCSDCGSEAAIAAAVDRLGVRACPAEAGDVWAYSTPILHASDRARSPGRRRVLRLLYSAETLPGGLEWLGV